MMLFSTVLFVDGNPVGYQVYKDEQNRLHLNPAENPSREVRPPILSAFNDGGVWTVNGTANRDLIDQVIEDITMNNLLPRTNLSAAP